ncbi:DUF4760 domain-containing protein [Jidongwangia harbinensis]|uniref:DUF4760 domain-containing protein n=1 Tax=Jidongwangia harbinensis TaxID=2878561 RepID=UPI001CDA250B|nr:hypothetical protein [Jidongwangia harbinensis]MCA2217752.1 hypothetical protein [Jidongwangia harbinensis]
MNASLVVSIVTVVISVLSLAVSGGLVLRQTRIAKDGYALPVVLDVFAKFRTEEFFTSYQYVLYRFRAEVPDVVGVTALPPEIRAHLRNVGGLYDDLGKLVAHGIVGEELVIGGRGDSVIRVWEIIVPFVYADRERKNPNLWIYLEDLASRAARNPAATIHAKLRLGSYPPAAVHRGAEGPAGSAPADPGTDGEQRP